MPVELYVEKLPHHPLLGRHVRHDSRSRAYALRAVSGVELVAVRHEAFISVLDQQVGSCTGDAGVEVIYRAPYFRAGQQAWFYPPTDTGATLLYSDATQIDPFPGAFPPEDTGSDGMSVAQVLTSRGIVTGFLHAFSLQAALQQLQLTPLMTGLVWLNSMFDTDDRWHAGHVVVRRDSGIAGGHELCVDEYVPAVGSAPALVGGPNSWGSSFGDHGRWYLTVDEWAWLLSQQGDVTALVPVTAPAPVPDPAPDDADRALWGNPRVRAFADADRHPYRPVRAALRAHRDAKGLG